MADLPFNNRDNDKLPSAPDRLTVDDLEKIASGKLFRTDKMPDSFGVWEGGQLHQRLASDLLDTLRENERLREACKAVDDLWTIDQDGLPLMSYKDETELWKSPVGIAWRKVREALSNKDTSTDQPEETATDTHSPTEGMSSR